MSNTTDHRRRRNLPTRLAVGLGAATLTAGFAATPAVAQDLPTGSETGIETANGWTPEGSVESWAGLAGQLSAQAVTDPAQLPYSLAMLPALSAATVIFGGAPQASHCGSFNTGPGCAGNTAPIE
jgi:hypothetical protein